MTDKRETTVDGEGQLARATADPFAGGVEAQEPGVQQLMLWLHVMLRGRYVLLVLLSLVLGAAAGYGGYRAGHKTYRSTGLIQIVKPLSVLGGQQEDSGQDGEAFISTQAGLLKSQRVIDMAMQNDEWVALRRPVKEGAVEEFTQALTVLAKDQIIYVSFEDRDARAVGAAVKSVIEAYRQLYIDDAANQNRHRLDLLEQHATALTNEESALKLQIDAIQNKYGTSEVGTIYNARRAQTDRLGDLLQEIKMRLALAPSAGATTRPAAEAAQDVDDLLERLEVEDLAQKDPTLREMVTERAGLERELRKLTSVHGYGETHPKVVEQKKAIESIGVEIGARAQRVRESLKRVKPMAIGGVGGAMDLEELRQKARMVEDLYQKAQQSALETGQESLRLDDLQEKRNLVRSKLLELRKRLEYLNMQTMAGDRIKILSDGSAAAAATTDTRIRLAAVGGVLGLMLAFGLSILPSLVDRRFRAADDTRVTSFLGPVLGVLPELPGDLSDEEHAAMAAYCVHQTRALLQMRNHGPHGQALAVTSSLAGTGKTSLTLALGASFATSGSRTLMIDCDLVGGGLSARVSRMTRRKIGHLLLREGLVSAEQLERALLQARGDGRRLGEVCVELGFVRPRDLQRVLESQEGEHLGVLEALAGESLEDCVAETGFPGLSILPLGSASARHCASLSPAALRRLLKLARARYDTILIDTGPVPGSLEASVAVPQADGVILVVSKGEHRPTVGRTVEYLRTIAANPVGVVFNRASLKEVAHNASTLHRSSAAFGAGSSASASSSGMGLRMNMEQSRRSGRLGPMAQAVAGCAPMDDDREEQA